VAVRTKATVIYETEINQQNDIRPFNEMRDHLHETHQQADKMTIPLHELLMKDLCLMSSSQTKSPLPSSI